MNILLHTLFNLIIAAALKFSIWTSLTWNQVIIIAIAAFLIDLDHVLYYAPKWLKPGMLRKEIAKARHNYINHLPHFLLFHNIEFLIAIFIISIFYPIAFYYLIGFMLHLLFDAITYISHYKKNFFWIKYWTIIYFIRK